MPASPPSGASSPRTLTADAVVIGAGPGGYVAAIRLAQEGRKVVCVDKEFLGGCCLNWGCIPSKAMIAASSLYESIRPGTSSTAKTMGIDVAGATVDLARMKAWKDTVVNRLTGGIGELFKRNGVQAVIGTATFLTADTLKVETKDGPLTVKTKQTLVATGTRVVQLPGLEVDGRLVLSAREALDLTVLPKSLLVIGGGIIGCEIGTYLAKLGTEVTIVELADTILAGVDPELVKVVARGMKKRGITVHTSSKVTHLERKLESVEATLATPKGELVVTADLALSAVGFRPNTDKLGLENVGVRLDKKGHVLVDKQLRTSNPAIFAIGDVIGPPYLAHKASHEGLVAAEVMAGKQVSLDVKAMPSAIFTDPEIATVGLTEEEARAAGHEPKVASFPFAANGRALSTTHSDGFVKIVADAKTDALLGMHVVGHEASNLIAEAALAIEAGLTVADVGLTVHAHPTLSEALMECAHVVEGHAIHIFVPKAPASPRAAVS